MKAIVTEIQVGGNKIVYSLEGACGEYLRMMKQEEGYRSKINFAIKLPNGKIGHITIRDGDGETVAYGDFEGLPSFLDYAQGC